MVVNYDPEPIVRCYFDRPVKLGRVVRSEEPIGVSAIWGKARSVAVERFLNKHPGLHLHVARVLPRENVARGIGFVKFRALQKPTSTRADHGWGRWGRLGRMGFRNVCVE